MVGLCRVGIRRLGIPRAFVDARDATVHGGIEYLRPSLCECERYVVNVFFGHDHCECVHRCTCACCMSAFVFMCVCVCLLCFLFSSYGWSLPTMLLLLLPRRPPLSQQVVYKARHLIALAYCSESASSGVGDVPGICHTSRPGRRRCGHIRYLATIVSCQGARQEAFHICWAFQG